MVADLWRSAPQRSTTIGAKPNLYCSPIGCGLVERKAQDRVKWEG